MNSTCKSTLVAQYQVDISDYPPELQTSGAVLFAIINAISSNSNNDGVSVQTPIADCHHFVDGQKMGKLQIVGPDATFLSLTQRSREHISDSGDAFVVEYSDSLSMRTAKATDFIAESTGNLAIRLKCILIPFIGKFTSTLYRNYLANI